MNFTWLCRNVYENFPTHIENMTNLNPTSEPERLHAPNTSVSKGDKEISDTGGCYGNGRYVLSSGFPFMNLSTEGMLESVEYLITLVVSKGRRRSIATQTLQLVPGDPPALTIRYRATLLRSNPKFVVPTESSVSPSPSKQCGCRIVMPQIYFRCGLLGQLFKIQA